MSKRKARQMVKGNFLVERASLPPSQGLRRDPARPDEADGLRR